MGRDDERQDSGLMRRALRVLAINDDEILCARWEAVLSAARIQLTVAGSVRAARRLIATGVWPCSPFDVVLLDVKLPDGSGVVLLDELRALDPVPRVAVVSAFVDAELWLFLRRMRVDCVSNPISPASLLELIDILIAEGVRAGPGRSSQINAYAQAFSLSELETAVLLYDLAGAPRARAAELLGISVHTVDTLWKRICSKTGHRSSSDVVRHIVRRSTDFPVAV